MQITFLRRAVRDSNWALHADKRANTTQSYHQYVDSRFSAIRTASRHNKIKVDNNSQPRILCIGRKHYWNHPSQSKKPSSISNGFTNHQNEKKTFHNRCFKCRTPSCSMRTCKHPQNPARIKRNLDDWKRLRRLNNIHFAYIIAKEAAEVFVPSEFIEDSANIDPPSSSKSLAPTSNEQPSHDPSAINFAFDQELSNETNDEEEILFNTTSDTPLDISLPCVASLSNLHNYRIKKNLRVKKPFISSLPLPDTFQTLPHQQINEKFNWLLFPPKMYTQTTYCNRIF